VGRRIKAFIDSLGGSSVELTRKGRVLDNSLRICFESLIKRLNSGGKV